MENSYEHEGTADIITENQADSFTPTPMSADLDIASHHKGNSQKEQMLPCTSLKALVLTDEEDENSILGMAATPEITNSLVNIQGEVATPERTDSMVNIQGEAATLPFEEKRNSDDLEVVSNTVDHSVTDEVTTPPHQEQQDSSHEQTSSPSKTGDKEHSQLDSSLPVNLQEVSPLNISPGLDEALVSSTDPASTEVSLSSEEDFSNSQHEPGIPSNIKEEKFVTSSTSQEKEVIDVKVQTTVENLDSNKTSLNLQEEKILVIQGSEDFNEEDAQTTVVDPAITIAAPSLTKYKKSIVKEATTETTIVQNENHISSPTVVYQTGESPKHKKTFNKEGDVDDKSESNSSFSSREDLKGLRAKTTDLEPVHSGLDHEMGSSDLSEVHGSGISYKFSRQEGTNTDESSKKKNDTYQEKETHTSGLQKPEKQFPYRFETVV